MKLLLRTSQCCDAGTRMRIFKKQSLPVELQRFSQVYHAAQAAAARKGIRRFAEDSVLPRKMFARYIVVRVSTKIKQKERKEQQTKEQ